MHVKSQTSPDGLGIMRTFMRAKKCTPIVEDTELT